MVELSCKLTTPDLRRRKETVLKSLKKKQLGKSELDNGFVFRFPANNDVQNELTRFVEVEKVCCDFFNFHVSKSPDNTELWLKITGPSGVKSFMKNELGL